MNQTNNGNTFFQGPDFESERSGPLGGFLRRRLSSIAITRAVWFVGLYSVSLLSFGALVGSVRWTLALV